MSSSESESNHPISDMNVEQGTSFEKMRPGAQLAVLRHENGWTIEQVARQLNLAPRQVDAIEADNYEGLPDAVVRGFVRAYAKLLKIDAAPLLNSISEGTQAPKEEGRVSRKILATPFSEARFPSMTDRPNGSGARFFIFLLIIFILAGAWFAQRNGYLVKLSQSISNKVSNSPEKTHPNTSDASIQKQLEPESLSVAIPQINISPDTSSPIVSSSKISSSVKQSEAGPVSSFSSEVPKAEAVAIGNTLILKIKKDSWVEIRRSNGSAVVSGIIKAGDTKTIEVTEPLSVVIGNALAVDVNLRGNPVEIKANAKNNVARLNLK